MASAEEELERVRAELRENKIELLSAREDVHILNEQLAAHRAEVDTLTERVSTSLADNNAAAARFAVRTRVPW